MYVEATIWDRPPDDTVIWRYMDFAKFVSLLSDRRLYFSRVDLLGDVYEGVYPKGNVLDPTALQNLPPEAREAFAAQHNRNLPEIARGFRQCQFVNCWH